MAAGIFISYRRDESRHAAGRLADDLSQEFGSEAIFRDIEGIDPGVDFTQSLERALGACVVMLVLIGRKWLDIADPQGRRRLENPDDWIRQEIATALKRDVRVIPVLLEGTAMPKADALPADMQDLVRRQALEMSDTRWRGDLQRLAETLEKVPGLQRPQAAVAAAVSVPAEPATPSGRGKPLLIGAAIGAVGLLVLAFTFGDEGEPSAALPSSNEYAIDPAPAADATLPNIAGVWRTEAGEVYVLEQSGSIIDFYAEAAGEDIGDGVGEFDGEWLRVTMHQRAGGVALGVVHCELRSGPNLASFSGGCRGSDGSFEAHIFK